MAGNWQEMPIAECSRTLPSRSYPRITSAGTATALLLKRPFELWQRRSAGRRSLALDDGTGPRFEIRAAVLDRVRDI